MDNQLETLLKNLKHDEEVRPSATFRTNARIRILNVVAQSKATSPVVHYRPAVLRYAVLFACVVFLLLGGTVYAAQSSGPNDTLFPVKILSERAALTLSPTEALKTDVAVTIIDRRASENEQAKKDGNTEEEQRAVTNFRSAVTQIRNTHRIDQEEVEQEIQKHEAEFETDSNSDTEEQKSSGDTQEPEDRLNTPLLVTSSPTPKEGESSRGTSTISPSPSTKESSVDTHSQEEVKGDSNESR